MSKTSTIVLVFGLVMVTAICRGELPLIVGPHLTTADKAQNLAASAINLKATMAEFTAMIKQARERFWKEYPHGKDYAAAEAAFSEALWNKNGAYLQICLPRGINDELVDQMNMFGDAPALTAQQWHDHVHRRPNAIDDGINPPAYPLFEQWVNSIRREAGMKKDGDILIDPTPLVNALFKESSRRHAYERAQIWAEAMASGVDVSKNMTPDVYMQLTMQTPVGIELGRALTAEVPDSGAETIALYDTLKKVMGEKEVAAAAEAMTHAPKNTWGGIATPGAVEIGTDVRGSSTDPLIRFLSLVTGSTPRNYAIALSLEQNARHTSRTATYCTKEEWTAALAQYEKVVAKYGEPAVLATATKLKAAGKSPTGGILGDPQVKPVLAWFQEALDDPKTVIPDGRMPHFNASSFNERWVGKFLEVRGTVSQVDLDKDGSPKYATIHFKEANGDSITGFSPNSTMLQSVYEKDFSGLVGKTVAISGEVQPWKQGAGVRILDLSQVRVVAAGFGSGEDSVDSKPDWLTAATPAEALVDSPEYTAWKKFPPGAKATYVSRLLQEYQPGMNAYTSMDISRTTFELKSIDDKRAIVVSSGTTFHVNPQQPKIRNEVPSVPVEHVYPAKQPVPASPVTAPNESGEKAIEISGQKFATHWTSMWGKMHGPPYTPDPMEFTQTWVSDEVPGGLVLMHVQTYYQVQTKDGPKPHRDIRETILQPVEGVAPRLGARAATQPAGKTETPAPVTQPLAKLAPAAPPAQRPAPAPAGSTQSQQYRAVASRVRLAKFGLAKLGLIGPQSRQTTAGTAAPNDVLDARDRLDGEMKALMIAMSTRDAAKFDENIKTVEETLDVIEAFLKK